MTASRHNWTHYYRVVVWVLLVGLGTAMPVHADGPAVDAVIDRLLQLDPQVLARRLGEMRGQADAAKAESEGLRAQAAAVNKELAAIAVLLEQMSAFVEPPEAMAAAPDAKGDMPVAVAKNFSEHVFPIIEKKCIKCHRDDKREGGLSLANFSQAMDGGGSGQVIFAGDPDGSRLVRLVNMDEEPYMPPKGKPLTDDQIDTIREWIELGAAADAGSKVMLAKRVDTISEEAFVAAEVREGPPPMPEVTLPTAATPTSRGIASRAVATSPVSPLVAIGGDKQILLYELAGYTLLGVLPFPEGDIYTMTFSVNGELLLAAGGEEGASASAIVWEVRTGKRIGAYGRGYDTILAADISPDHAMIALGGPDRKVRVYDSASGEVLYEMANHTDWIYSVKFSPDGELLATADRAGGLLLWQAANGRAVEGLRGHNGAIHDLTYTYDSNVLASAGSAGEVIYWDTWAYKQIRKIGAHSGPVLSVHFSKKGDLLSSGRDGLTKRWDLAGKGLATYENAGDWAYQTRFGATDSLVLAGNWSGRVFVWNVESKERVAELITNPKPEAQIVVASGAAGEAE